MESYQDLKYRIESLVRKAELDAAFELLNEQKELLSAELRTELLLLEARYNQLQKDKIQNQINTADYTVGLSNLSKGLLYILDQEFIAGVNSPAERSASGKRKEGFILHDIPRKMPLNTITKVVVRLADEEFDLLEDFEKTIDTKIESVRVSDVMEVHLEAEDPSAFDVRSSSGDQQFLESDTYTEWIFKVRPLKVGAHILELKVVVLELVNNKERRRSAVLERSVQVVTEFIDLPEASFSRLVWATSIELGEGTLAKRVKGDPRLAGGFSHLAYQDMVETMEAKKKAAQQKGPPPSPPFSKKSKKGKNSTKKGIKSNREVEKNQVFPIRWVLVAILLILVFAILVLK